MFFKNVKHPIYKNIYTVRSKIQSCVFKHVEEPVEFLTSSLRTQDRYYSGNNRNSEVSSENRNPHMKALEKCKETPTGPREKYHFYRNGRYTRPNFKTAMLRDWPTQQKCSNIYKKKIFHYIRVALRTFNTR